MFPKSQIVIMDDQSDHLLALAEGLRICSASCQVVLFNEDLDVTQLNFENVRIFITDLHLTAGTHDVKQHSRTIANTLKESISPENGPFILILWTQRPDDETEFKNELFQIPETALPSTSRPLLITGMDKSNYLNLKEKKLSEPDKFKSDIIDIICKIPQFASLINWEARIAHAAGKTTFAINDLISTENRTEKTYGPELDRILSTLAIEAVGKKNAQKDILSAVNLSLHGILFDEINCIQTSSEDMDLWADAVTDFSGTNPLPEKEIGQLNKKFHISEGESAFDRGAVIPLPEAWKQPEVFVRIFGYDICAVGNDEFKIPEFEKKNFNNIRWIILQVQAACDYAQRHPGPLPFILGMEIPLDIKNSKNRNFPDHVWVSRVLDLNGEQVRLAFNPRFSFSVSPLVIENFKPTYRLRTDMVNFIAYHLHSLQARPGMIEFKPK